MAGLTSTGLTIKRYDEILLELNENLKNQIKQISGSNTAIDTSELSIAGIFNSIFALATSDLWELGMSLYEAQDILRAEGDALDNAVLSAGFFRKNALPTRGPVNLVGDNGTLIPAKSKFKSLRGDTFLTVNDVTLSNRNCYSLKMKVLTLLDEEIYRVTVNDIVYDYNSSLTGTIASQADGGTGFTVITDVGHGLVDGKSVTISGTTAYNGVHEVSDVTVDTYKIPVIFATNEATGTWVEVATEFNILTELAALINAGGLANATVSLDEENEYTLFIETAVVDTKVDVTSTTFLSNYSIKTPTVVVSEKLGPIAGDRLSITTIVTTIGGLETIENTVDLTLGSDKESDEELRLRVFETPNIAGTATPDSIKGSIYNLAGVRSVKLIENKTLEPYTNGVLTSIVEYVVTGGTKLDIKAEIDTLITAIQATAGTPSASYLLYDQPTYMVFTISIYGGTESLIAAEIATAKATIEALSPTPVVSVYENYDATSGLPPKTYNVVVQGGDDTEIAYDLWRTRPATGRQFGTTVVEIVDKYGQDQTVKFSRPLTQYLYLLVNYELYNEEIFPLDGVNVIKQLCLEYGSSLDIGEDVIPQRFYSDIYKNVPGISHLRVGLVKNVDGNLTPSDIDYLEEVKVISDSEISSFALTRIRVEVAP